MFLTDLRRISYEKSVAFVIASKVGREAVVAKVSTVVLVWAVADVTIVSIEAMDVEPVDTESAVKIESKSAKDASSHESSQEVSDAVSSVDSKQQVDSSSRPSQSYRVLEFPFSSSL
jgi:hypothetical protein